MGKIKLKTSPSSSKHKTEACCGPNPSSGGVKGGVNKTNTSQAKLMRMGKMGSTGKPSAGA